MKSEKTVVDQSAATVGHTSQFQKRFVPVKCKNRSGNSVILMAEISVVNDVFLHRNGSPEAKGRLHWNAGYFLILKHASEAFGDDFPSKQAALDEPKDADIQELAMQQETPDDVASSTSSYETMVTKSPFIAHFPAEADGSTSIHQTPYDEAVEKFAKVTLDSAFPFNTTAGSF